MITDLFEGEVVTLRATSAAVKRSDRDRGRAPGDATRVHAASLRRRPTA